jgi:diguanylate cyclase (GGDEF)-like protein/PAS domain S-box-containing protein
MSRPRPKRGNVELPLAVLIVEDLESDAQLIIRLLRKTGYEVISEQVETAEQMRAALEKRTWDIVISDYSLPQFDGHAALDILKEKQRDIPFIVVSGAIGEETAVAMMKAGANDYLMKDNLARLVPAVSRELEQAQNRRAHRLAEEELVNAREHAEESEEKFKAITNQATEGIALSDLEGNYVFVNPSFGQMMGYSEEELLKMTVFDVKAKTQSPGSFYESKTTKEGLPIEVKLRRRDGTEFFTEIIGRVIKVGDKDYVLGTVRDITERKRAEDRLRQLSSAVEHSPISIVIMDITGNIEYVNLKFTEVTGFTLDEVRGKTPQDTFGSSNTQPETRAEHWQTILSGNEWRGEMENCKKNGESYWAAVSISPITDSNGIITHFVSINEDITVRKENEEKIQRLNAGLEQLAMTDYLTNLYNRRYFMQRGAEEFKRARRNNQPLALLMMDIDHFKNVNDTYGHDAGDMALQQVAATLKSSLREIDILGRIGGEEFAVLLPNISLHEAAVLAERVRKAVAGTSVEIPGGSLTITISIGVAVLTNETSGIDNILKNADVAMYQAKSCGGNCVV